MGLMPWRDSCTLVLTVSKSLVSHDMACPQVSPSLPRAPCPGFLPSQRTVAAKAVLWYLVTGSGGWGQLSGCNFSPWWKVRGSEGVSLGLVNKCTWATSLCLLKHGRKQNSKCVWIVWNIRASAGSWNFNQVSGSEKHFYSKAMTGYKPSVWGAQVNWKFSNLK